jgi:hypothetical protein
MLLCIGPSQHYERNIEQNEWPSKTHKIGSVSTQNMSEILLGCSTVQHDRKCRQSETLLGSWTDRSRKQGLVRMVAKGRL